MNLTQPMPYVAVQALIDNGNPKGNLNYWTADFLDDLPDKAVDALCEVATQPVSVLTAVIIIPGGGALSRVDDNAMAFGQRNAPWNIHILVAVGGRGRHREEHRARARDLTSSVKPWSTGRAYLNFIGDEGPGRVEAAFGPEKFAKLRELKKKWDPTNLFRHNQNIPPAYVATRPSDHLAGRAVVAYDGEPAREPRLHAAGHVHGVESHRDELGRGAVGARARRGTRTRSGG